MKEKAGIPPERQCPARALRLSHAPYARFSLRVRIGKKLLMTSTTAHLSPYCLSFLLFPSKGRSITEQHQPLYALDSRPLVDFFFFFG